MLPGSTKSWETNLESEVEHALYFREKNTFRCLVARFVVHQSYREYEKFWKNVKKVMKFWGPQNYQKCRLLIDRHALHFAES